MNPEEIPSPGAVIQIGKELQINRLTMTTLLIYYGHFCCYKPPLVERLMTTPLITGPVTVLISVNTFCSSVNGALAT
jgi:hypothetical protein